MNNNTFFTNSFKEMIKFCSRILKIIIVKCGEIWFLWRNMVLCSTMYVNKIHLWRHSIVLALHYFQGMACYRSATLLEVMDTRYFWNMFVFSRVMYRQSWISEEHSNKSCFSMNKKKSMVTARLEPTPSIRCGLSFMSPPLYQLSYHSAEGEGLNSDF